MPEIFWLLLIFAVAVRFLAVLVRHWATRRGRG